MFRNESPLPGLTLNIGDYVTRQLIVDSVTYELHVWRKHASLLKLLNDRLLPSSVREGTSARSIIRGTRHVAEISAGNKYPYKRFTTHHRCQGQIVQTVTTPQPRAHCL